MAKREGQQQHRPIGDIEIQRHRIGRHRLGSGQPRPQAQQQRNGQEREGGCDQVIGHDAPAPFAMLVHPFNRRRLEDVKESKQPKGHGL